MCGGTDERPSPPNAHIDNAAVRITRQERTGPTQPATGRSPRFTAPRMSVCSLVSAAGRKVAVPDWKSRRTNECAPFVRSERCFCRDLFGSDENLRLNETKSEGILRHQSAAGHNSTPCFEREGKKNGWQRQEERAAPPVRLQGYCPN